MKMRQSTTEDINFAVKRARKKHDYFAEDDFQIVSLAAEELGEFAQAINDGDKIRAHVEALDLIVVLVRYLEGDSNKDSL